MNRVLLSAALLTVVLFNCSSEATVLRELIKALLDLERGLFDQNGPHGKVIQAIETLNSANGYLKEVSKGIEEIGDNEVEVKKLLTPICTQFLTKQFAQRFVNSFKTSISNTIKDVKKTDDGVRPDYCANVRAEALNDGNNKERVRKETVNPETLRTKVDKDVKTAYIAYNQLYLACNENPKRDVKDLQSLLETHDKVSKKIQAFEKDCKKYSIPIPNEMV